MSEGSIVLYTSRPCGQCDKVRDMLDSWEVTYEERMLSEDPGYLKTLQEAGIYGTPVTFIGDDRVLGVQENKLKKKVGA
ncbi:MULTISPECIES: glutaredoxin family protein [Salimicrobium]|uniref:NrdH-redoxin n=1 Tax=Salimicrobium humidisoli TaxID=2029857 RepID=A0ABX4HS58_9BACI|nr:MULTISPECIES: glutaredoxin family protein [Salimicrobium]PBB06053.1 NrdH-redoxin [Salimicrobium humidisoli]